MPGKGVIESDWKSDLHIEPMLRTQWSQRAPYNNATPLINGVNALAGCDPIAVAQIMAYYRYPAQLAGNVLDWPLILKRNSGMYCSCPNQNHTVLAKFIRTVGDYCSAEYGLIETNTDWRAGSVALQNMGYHHPYGLIQYDYARIEKSLRMSLPVYVRGSAIKVQHKGLGLVWWNTYEGGRRKWFLSI